MLKDKLLIFQNFEIKKSKFWKSEIANLEAQVWYLIT